MEESFSWTPQSRKAFLREVPLLSSRAHLGAQKWAVPFQKKNGGEGGGGGGGGGGGTPIQKGETSRGTPPPPPHDGHFEGWGSVGRGLN